MLIRAGDNVKVIAGASRGLVSRVIRVDRRAGKALVENVGRVFKHVRRNSKHPQGGRLSKEMPVEVSNLAFVCPSCASATRLGARFQESGAKERFCRKCGEAVGEIAPARKGHATPARR